MKRHLYILLCLLGLTVSANMYAGDAPAEFKGPTWWDYRDQTFSIEGKGTLLNPIVINTAEELAQLSYLHYNSDILDMRNERVVVLGADINLNRTEDGQRVQWIPIGYKYGFSGIFLGINTSGMENGDLSTLKRHTISGMYINIDASDGAGLNNQRYFGLFGRFTGFTGYVNITDANISVNVSNSSNNMWVGILSGICEGTAKKYETAPSQSLTVYPVIDAVSVSGTLNMVGNTNHTYGVGGVTALLGHCGIFHSSSDVSINAINCNLVGGIAGTFQDGYKDIEILTITDCSAAANIQCVNEGTETSAYAGGIVGEIHNPKMLSIYACSSTGSINCTGKFQAGGICGNTHETFIQGCASMVSLSGNGELGGIVGHMYNYSSNPGFEVKNCIYGAHINATEATYAGGFCGNLEWNDNEEHINGCLFTGTMDYTAGATNYSVTVGKGNAETLLKNITYCYYDKTLYNGNIAPGLAELTSFEVKGLTTEKLTSADVTTLAFLPTIDSAPCGYRLTKGYYPEVYNNNTSYYPKGDYYGLQSNNNGSDLSEIFQQLFCSAHMYKENTVYRTGTWLCSLPVYVPTGDAAYDLVTHVVSPRRNIEWQDQGQSIKLNSKVSYQNVPCIKVNNDTAFAAFNGKFLTTITAKPDRPKTLWNRPLPITSSKSLGMVSTIDQVWDGTIASGYAAGTGKKEDPYIIKNGAQLAYAVKNNQEGKCYKQLCDITLFENRINESGYGVYIGNNWFKNLEWKAIYDGDNHFIKGIMIDENSGLFGNISSSGEVSNLGLADCLLMSRSGAFAYQMNGKISNCIAEGLATPINSSDPDYYHLGYCGGFCSVIGNTNSNAIIEDCVSAMSCLYFMYDYTPFVSLSDENKGKVQNCIFVVPVGSDDKTFSGTHTTAAGHDYIQNCYWLKGYEPLNTGCTLDEMGNAIGKRSLWTWNKGYFPMLKSFAKSDMGKLLSLPFRSDIDYTFDPLANSSTNCMMGFSKQITFEPGTAVWTTTSSSYVELDGDMGVIAPVQQSYTPQADYSRFYKTRTIIGAIYLKATLGKFKHFVITRTSDSNITKGITFVDDNARDACLDAFDTNKDGFLSLAEIKAATNEQTLGAFQTNTAKLIKHFPEFRFFKNVTELTGQLKGMKNLEDVQLPYALQTIAGGESDAASAFYGCDKLKTVTISSKVKNVMGHPFYGSAVENILVDPMNEDFVSRDGVLYDTNNVLVAYPNGRTGEEAVFTGTIIEICEDAIYKVDGLERIYFETDDYTTVPYMNENGFVSTRGELMDVYVSDATYGSVLMQGYYDDGSWDDYVDAGKLHCYYPLKISSAKAATLYIGFDTELPSGLKPYIVPYVNEEQHVATLQQMKRKIPSRSPVIILADEPGLYRLSPLDENLKPWNMYQNRLNGVGRDGMRITQIDSDRGGILTLGHNSQGDLGFFYYTKLFLPPYRAYLTHGEVEEEPEGEEVHYFLYFDDDDSDIVGIEKLADSASPDGKNSHTLYDMQGRPVSETAARPGIYIKNGRKVLIK